MSCLEVRHLSGCQITSCILSAHYSMYKHASFVATAPKEPCHTGGPREGASGRHVLACQRKQSKPRGSTLAGFMRMEEVQDPEPSNPIVHCTARTRMSACDCKPCDPAFAGPTRLEKVQEPRCS
eukprot:scaffold37338_cov19-Tisochrysis_lutea.AAC.1